MICLETINPYGDSVSFDNIFQSLELVFVVMSGNTFSDIMYYLMDSERLAAGVCFAVIIIVLYYWLIILFIGVFTGSLREVRDMSRDIEPSAVPKPPLQVRYTTLQKWLHKSRWIWIAIIFYGLCVQTRRNANMSLSRIKFMDYSEKAVTLLLAIEIFDFRSIEGDSTTARRICSILPPQLSLP
jgi:hypothetical protein